MGNQLFANKPVLSTDWSSGLSVQTKEGTVDTGDFAGLLRTVADTWSQFVHSGVTEKIDAMKKAKLRLVRTGSDLEAMYYDGSVWQSMAKINFSDEDVYVRLNTNTTRHMDIDVKFDNYRVNSGTICNPVVIPELEYPTVEALDSVGNNNGIYNGCFLEEESLIQNYTDSSVAMSGNGGDCVVIPNTDAMDVLFADTFVISFIIRSNVHYINEGLISKRTLDSSQMLLSLGANNKLTLLLEDDQNVSIVKTFEQVLENNETYRISMVVNRSNNTAYVLINGAKQEIVNIATLGSIVNNEDLILGKGDSVRTSSNVGEFSGLLDDMYLSKNIPSEERELDLYLAMNAELQSKKVVTVGGNDENTVLLLHCESVPVEDYSICEHINIDNYGVVAGDTGKYFKCYDFSAQLSKVTIPFSNHFNFRRKSFTIEFYVNFDGGKTFPFSRGLDWSIELTNKLCFNVSKNKYEGSLPIQANTFVHVAITRDSNSRLRFFIDGKLDPNSYLLPYDFNTTNALTIGYNDEHTELFTGKLDEIRISNTVRYIEDFELAEGPFDGTGVMSSESLEAQAEVLAYPEADNGGIDNKCVLMLRGLDDVTGRHNVTTDAVESVGMFDKGLEFNNSSFDLQPSDDFRFRNSNFTIDLWFKKNDLNSGIVVGADAANEWYISADTNVHLNINTLEYNGIYTGSIDLTTDNHHLALVRIYNELCVFVDGVKDISVSLIGLNMVSTTLTVGGSSVRNFNGVISEVRAIKGEAVWRENFSVQNIEYVDRVNNIPDEGIDNNTILMLHGNDYIDATSISSVTIDTMGVLGVDGTMVYNFTNSGSLNIDLGHQIDSDFTIDFKFLTTTLNGSLFSFLSALNLSLDDGSLVLHDSTDKFITGLINTNTWYHLELTRHDDIVYLFINGNLIHSKYIVDLTINQYLMFGGSHTANRKQDIFTGYMGEIRVSTCTRHLDDFIVRPIPYVIKPIASETIHEAYGIDENTALMIYSTDDVDSGSIINGVGKFDRGLSFSGSISGRTSLPEKCNFGLGEYTIEFFLRPETQLTRNNSIISTRMEMIAGKFDIGLGYNGEGSEYKLSMHGTSHVLNSGTSIPSGVWNHVAFVRKDLVLKLYINGVLSDTVSDGNFWSADLADLGKGVYTEYYVGGLSDIRLSNTARYLSDFPVPTIQFHAEYSYANTLVHLQNKLDLSSFNSNVRSTNVNEFRGVVDRALLFDSGSNVVVQSNDIFNVDKLYISFFMLSQNTEAQTLVSKGNVFKVATNSTHLTVSYEGGYTTIDINNILDGTFHKIYIELERSLNVKVYVDGLSKTTSIYGEPISLHNVSDVLVLGDAGAESFKGLIEDFVITRKQLHTEDYAVDMVNYLDEEPVFINTLGPVVVQEYVSATFEPEPAVKPVQGVALYVPEYYDQTNPYFKVPPFDSSVQDYTEIELMDIINEKILAHGWELVDDVVKDKQKGFSYVYRSLNEDNVSYKYVNVDLPDSLTGLSVNVYEDWDVVNHTGINKAVIHTDSNLNRTLIPDAVGMIKLFVSKHYIAFDIPSNEDVGLIGCFEISKDLEDEVPGEYPRYAFIDGYSLMGSRVSNEVDFTYIDPDNGWKYAGSEDTRIWNSFDHQKFCKNYSFSLCRGLDDSVDDDANKFCSIGTIASISRNDHYSVPVSIGGRITGPWVGYNEHTLKTNLSDLVPYKGANGEVAAFNLYAIHMDYNDTYSRGRFHGLTLLEFGIGQEGDTINIPKDNKDMFNVNGDVVNHYIFSTTYNGRLALPL